MDFCTFIPLNTTRDIELQTSCFSQSPGIKPGLATIIKRDCLCLLATNHKESKKRKSFYICCLYMYILKTRNEYPAVEYIQIRDEDFTLVIYCKTERLFQQLKENNLLILEEEIKKVLPVLQAGNLHKLKTS